MLNLQKAGGIAAMIEALFYILGFAVLATLLNPGDVDGWSSLQKLAFILERKAIFQAWMIGIYVVFGLLLVVLSVALHERFKAHSLGLMQVATAFGLIWAGLVIASGMVAVIGLDAAATLHGKDAAQAALLWSVIGTLQEGLGGGVEIVGGLWVLLLSVVAMRSRVLPAALNYVGLAVGLAGVLTMIPWLGDLAVIFGLGQILWFAWIGALMLRRANS